jgi:hypothetical protein
MTKKANLAANVSAAVAGDVARNSRNQNVETDVQWSWRFGPERNGSNQLQGQFFIRAANHYARVEDRIFGLNSLSSKLDPQYGAELYSVLVSGFQPADYVTLRRTKS